MATGYNNNVFDVNKGFKRYPLNWFNTIKVFDGRKFVGTFYLHASYIFDNYIDFSSFVIETDKRNLGYGKKIMSKLIEELKQKELCKGIMLSCNENNFIARKLYKSFGFRCVKDDLFRLKF